MVSAEDKGLSLSLSTQGSEHPEHRHAVGSTDEYLAVGDRRRDELVAGADGVTPAGGLRAVVELGGEIARIVRMQDRRSAVLVRPDDAVGVAVGRDGRRGAGIGEAERGLRRRSGGG